MMSTSSLPARSAVDPATTWNIASVFASAAEWDQALADVDARIPAVAARQGTLTASADALLAGLVAAEELLNAAQTVAMFAFLAYSVDTTDQDAAARSGRARSLMSRVGAALAFIEPELLEMDDETLAGWCREHPRLSAYTHYFQRLARRRPHTRSAEVEEVLGRVVDPFSTAASIHGVLTNADLRFEPAVSAADDAHYDVAQSTIGALITHRDRSVRRSAWLNYADAHLAVKNTAATCLLAGVKQNVFMARARRYPSSLEAALQPDGIPVAVFHQLIETFRRHLPVWHRYWRVRRRALAVAELHEYDLKAPLTDQAPVVPYEQAVAWIAEGMRPLGDDYCRILTAGALADRWVDIYPNQGKRAGAFSYGVSGTHPFIMMSYTDDLFSVSTLAHELGHSMHSYLTWQTQPLTYSNYSLFVAEVASNANQALVRAHLFETMSDRAFQIGLIEEAMANFHRYFFIMPTLARFELALHEQVEQGNSPSADDMIELMADLFAEGYGDEVTYDRLRTGITWAQFSSHLYANFYVYQYATGLAGAHALTARILEQEDGAVERYLAFLRSGSSREPLDALQAAGVDLTAPHAVEETFGVLAGLIDRLEQLIA